VSVLEISVLLVALALLGYLVITLLFPERF
jgi:K+-transporting ATPase KdpF subunit